MAHEGNKVRELSHKKGFKQVELAAMRGVTKQTINSDFSREKLGVDTLKWYSSVLGVSIEDLTQSDESKEKNQDVNWKEMYFQALQKIDKLTTAIIENGIKVDLGKFDVISLPRVSSLYFFGFTNTTDNICE